MTEENTPANPQAGDATEIKTPAQAATTTPDPQAGDGHETISLEEARKLRKEAQALRLRLKTFEDAEEQAKLAALSDVEKVTKRATDAEQLVKQYQERLVLAEVKMAAQAKGIIDPDLAALAIKGQLEFGKDGLPTNIEDALIALVKNKPYLVPKTATPPPAQQESPAVSPATQTPPVLPPMSPGRTNIAQPSTRPPGQPPRLSDVWQKPPR